MFTPPSVARGHQGLSLDGEIAPSAARDGTAHAALRDDHLEIDLRDCIDQPRIIRVSTLCTWLVLASFSTRAFADAAAALAGCSRWVH